VQAIANGGVLVIDDFGRQRCPPRTCSNQGSPLDSRAGLPDTAERPEVELPIMTLIARDEYPAGGARGRGPRRIPIKIFAESPTVDDFKSICHLLPRPRRDSRGGPVERLLMDYYRPRNIGCGGVPAERSDHARRYARPYLNRPAHLTMELLEAACNSYFVNDREDVAVYA
jgi:hypothetical protein